MTSASQRSNLAGRRPLKNLARSANLDNEGPTGCSRAGLFSLVLASLISAQLLQVAQACRQISTHYGTACECTDAHCDSELRFDWPQDDASLLRMVSNEAGARFQLGTVRVPDEEPPRARERAHFHVALDINKRHQQVVGYGGAFTDSASMLIKQRLSAESSAALMRSYFGPAGLNYNLARVPIGGTDMSWRPYSYDDLADGDEDFELRRFRLQEEDLKFKLPLIRQARALRPASQPLRLLASSWSAPNWMKSNNKLVQGRLKDDSEGAEAALTRGQDRIDGKYYDAYARYIIRFLDEYERELGALVDSTNGSTSPQAPEPFKIWALTPQNEPCTPGRLGHSVVNYNSVNFTPDQIERFVRAHLVPSLLAANRTARDVALFVWDDTLLGLEKYKDHLFRVGRGATKGAGRAAQELAPFVAADKPDAEFLAANDYVRGLALHWYSHGLDKVPYRLLYDLRRWLPSQFSLLSTEASFIGRPQPGDWSRGERYARDIIMNLRAGSLGWIDWNLALNEAGGPTWSRNFLDSAVLVREATGSYLKNPMFYAIGHLSRFIRADSHVVESQVWQDVASRSFANATQAWRLVDERGEQASELLVVASEQAAESGAPKWRRVGLALLNRAAGRRRVSLSVANCKSRAFERRPTGPQSGKLELELSAKSITSLAFNC